MTRHRLVVPALAAHPCAGQADGMPEGDVVHRTAARLHAALAGRVLTRTDLRWPTLATVDLSGREVEQVVSVGKHLLLRVAATEDGDAALTLHSHLRMEGSWHLHRTGSAPARESAHDVRAVLANREWTAVGHRLGMLDLVPTAAEGRLVGHLGPDVLAPSWDSDGLEQAERNLVADPNRAIGEALLDQRVLAGVGTFYLAESLFVRGITPWTPVRDIADVRGLLALVHRMLAANADAARVTQSTTGELRPGRSQWVHGRAGRACRRCGARIRVAPIGKAPQDRVAFYCPGCQRGPVG